MIWTGLLACIVIVPVLSQDSGSTYQKLGCYRENPDGVVLFNVRDKIDWEKSRFPAYVKRSLTSPCEQRAKKEGFTHFSIRFYGICVGFKSYNKAGARQTNCKDTTYSSCNDASSLDCVGTDWSDYIYIVGQNGGYSEWSDWGVCSVTCDSGSVQRSRECNNPVKLGNGNPCSILGPSIEINTCTRAPCVKAVDGGFSDWSDYSSCTKSCGGGVQTKTRECNKPVPQNGGKDCEGSKTETRVCGVNLCPLDGGFSDWSDYSSCTKSCGGGVQTKTRECNKPVPQNGGKDCDGSKTETRPCGVNLCPVDGGFSDWSDYSSCTKSCGGGVQTKTRECNKPVPQNGGKDCDGSKTETRPCGVNLCPVDGGFSDWSDFSSCTKTCGGGVQTKTRECDNPKPQSGGKDCIGSKTETRGCKNDFCPGPDGVTKAQKLVDDFLSKFYVESNPGKPISGKSLKAIFEIQKAVAAEFISADPTSRKPVETLLKELEEFLITAAKGGSIDFARVTLGKSLFNFMKKEIANGLPIDDINKASEGYLEHIKSKVGNDKFSQIISSQGASTLMFVMDTTGSMSEEINAAKGIAKAIIDTTREFPVDYILSPFNDPDLGPVVYKSEKQRAEVIDAITKLPIYGGGDCPELAFGGMLNAFNKGPQYSSPMFVFTDASAKDDSKSNMDALKAASLSYSSPITFFANLDGCGTGINSFKEIAAYSSGQVFPLKDDKEIMSFTEYVKSSLQQDTVIASGETSKGSRMKRQAVTSFDFFVDDGIEKIIVSASTSTLNTANLIQLRFEDGKLASPSTTTSMTQIFQVSYSDKGFFGKWTLTLPSSAADCKYSVQAVSSDPIEFSSSFAYQQHPIKNSPVYLFSDPIRGMENNMIVRVAGGNINLSSFKCQILSLKGSSLSDLSLLRQENGLFSAKVTPPDSPFKLKCYGLTKRGSNFERISLGVSKAKTTFMVPIFAGNMFTVRFSNTIDAQVLVFNFDNEESITFTVKASHGVISPATQSLTIRKNTFLLFKYSAPSDYTLVGTTARITISAQRDVSKEEFSSTFSVLIV